MGFLTDKLGLPEGASNFLGGLFETGANYAAASDVVDRLSKVGGTLAEGFPKIGEKAAEMAEFKPFTVTTGTGTVTTTPEGGFTTNYSNNNYSNRVEDVDKAKRIARQSSLTRAVEFHLKKLESGITISETEILEQAQRFTDWVMDNAKKESKDNNDFPF